MKANAHTATKPAPGTSRINDQAPEKPAFDVILQAGTIHEMKMITKISQWTMLNDPMVGPLYCWRHDAFVIREVERNFGRCRYRSRLFAKSDGSTRGGPVPRHVGIKYATFSV
jgi:hypothetical protein